MHTDPYEIQQSIEHENIITLQQSREVLYNLSQYSNLSTMGKRKGNRKGVKDFPLSFLLKHPYHEQFPTYLELTEKVEALAMKSLLLLFLS